MATATTPTTPTHGVYSETLTAEQKAAVAAAVSAGHIKEEPAIVKITNSKDKERPFTMAYTKRSALDLDGALVLCEQRMTSAERGQGSVLGHFNYGFDLDVKGTVRSTLAGLIEGPDKVIERTAKDLVASGTFDTMEEAEAFVRERRKAKGLDV